MSPIKLWLWPLALFKLNLVAGAIVGDVLELDASTIDSNGTTKVMQIYYLTKSKLHCMYFDNQRPNQIYVGGTNILYKLHYNIKLHSDYSFFYVQVMPVGPLYQIGCHGHHKAVMNNTITTIFASADKQMLLVCGSAGNGVCLRVRNPYNQHFIRKFEVFGDACDQKNLVGGLKSTAVLPVPYRSANGTDYDNVFFVGMEYDGRAKRYYPPFLSLRSINANFTGFDRILPEQDEPSEMRLHPDWIENFRIKILGSFVWKHYAYFLTSQPSGAGANTTVMKLARVCLKSMKLDTWTQVPLQCHKHSQRYTLGVTGSLAQQVNIMGEEFSHETSNVVRGQLFMAFADQAFDDHVVCIYELDQINETLDQAWRECARAPAPSVRLMSAVYGGEKKCSQVNNDQLDFSCCADCGDNHFLDVQTPVTSKAIFVISNDNITSLGSITWYDPKHELIIKQNVFVGTQHTLLAQLSIAGGAVVMDFANQLPGFYGRVLPGLAVHIDSMTLLVLTEQGLFHIPLVFPPLPSKILLFLKRHTIEFTVSSIVLVVCIASVYLYYVIVPESDHKLAVHIRSISRPESYVVRRHRESFPKSNFESTKKELSGSKIVVHYHRHCCHCVNLQQHIALKKMCDKSALAGHEGVGIIFNNTNNIIKVECCNKA